MPEETVPAFPCGWPAPCVFTLDGVRFVRWDALSEGAIVEALLTPDEAVAIGHALMQLGREASK